MTTTPRKPAAKRPAKKAAAKKAPAKPRIPKPENPWDQQVDETGVAYAAFCVYRDMGLTRSLTKAAKQVGKDRSLLTRWSTTHSWVMRAGAHDREAEREWNLRKRQLQREAAERNASIAQNAFTAISARIIGLMARLDEMSPGDVARLMDAASKLERLALGQSTDSVEHTGPGGGPIQTADLTLLTDEERLTRMQQLRDELSKRLERDTEEEAS